MKGCTEVKREAQNPLKCSDSGTVDPFGKIRSYQGKDHTILFNKRC